MPRRRRRAKSRRWPAWHEFPGWFDLLLGWCEPKTEFDFGRATMKTVDEVREAWEYYKGEILTSCRMGSRPWGWWLFTAPERFRRDRLTRGPGEPQHVEQVLLLQMAKDGLIDMPDQELKHLEAERAVGKYAEAEKWLAAHPTLESDE